VTPSFIHSVHFVGGTSRFPRTPCTGPLARTGGFAAGLDIEIKL
jgi:hypothetical protein